MKTIAIQFYGHVRTFDKCFQQFIDNILIPNVKDGYNIDIFIHTWNEFSTKTEGVWHNNKNYYPTLNNKKLKECDVEKIIKIYRPKKIVVDDVEDKYRKMIFNGNHKNGSDVSFEKVVKIRKEYESQNNIKYDYILTTRMDILFLKEFKINTFVDIYNSNSCIKQVPLPEKYILTHIDTTFKVLDIAYPTDAPLFFISNFDIIKIKDLFYNFHRLVIFCDYRKNIDFKILREADTFQVKPIFMSAKMRIRNHLSYKLGQAMMVNSKSLLGYIRMPFVLSYIKDNHKQEQRKYQEKIKQNPSLKLPSLENYSDYKEALKEKECLTYKLGQALMQADKTWYKGGYIKLWFEIRKLKKGK